MADGAWIAETRNDLVRSSRQLAASLEEYGFQTEGINPLFVYASHDRAGEIFEHLAARHILVRPFPDRKRNLRFGLCRDDDELARLAGALKEFGNG